ncbi:phosphatase 2C-like domain-containing protein [Pelagophyceae sp. CCMP2097]|nr:phosphatase 2C-like domain-containing protein [Pelagophyceae sp. CCMP2097]
MAYFGIFDGHGGHACATLLQHGLHTALACRADLHADGRAAAAAAFRKVDDDCCTSLRSSDDASGSTALVAVYDGRARQLVVAHAGDSRCVLCAGGGAAVALTSDHRLTRTDERARIEAAGGLIVNNRLNGTLAISRSFGDVAHKGGAGAPTVTATPEVTIRAIAADDEFVVLGSDGLWDALSNQSVVNFVRTELGAHHDLHKAAVSTTAEALRRGSVDNVSCIIVLFT